MAIRPATINDLPTLLEIWIRAVRATHHFLSEADIQHLTQQLQTEYLPQLPCWLHENKAGDITGFMGIMAQKVEMLFVDPAFHRQGIGRQLLDFACQDQPIIYIDVNEQNPIAHQFYLHYGFEPYDYSTHDPDGRPYPIIHMKRVKS